VGREAGSLQIDLGLLERTWLHVSHSEHPVKALDAKTQRSLLLKLPPELRNQIYGYFFEDHPSSVIVYSPKSAHAWSGPPELLQTCKQIREEASSIFYCDRTFIVEPAPFRAGGQSGPKKNTLEAFLSSLGSQARLVHELLIMRPGESASLRFAYRNIDERHQMLQDGGINISKRSLVVQVKRPFCFNGICRTYHWTRYNEDGSECGEAFDIGVLQYA
jgi:hypothetical protein